MWISLSPSFGPHLPAPFPKAISNCCSIYDTVRLSPKCPCCCACSLPPRL
ncbi:hypothetical protein CPB84DRAFT_1764476 [Gymnopilus junonius]|uniref:Uncharacterized protein n=1 Tax=Gymnopilus junonius TaxID=109634 RepID=A0A9P5NUV1_GYMJU|nr:hypothetical protein CPB84DRAFT_1764476 [Gymnopilus junonius]